MRGHITSNVALERSAAAAGAATTAVTGTAVDMSGWDGVLFVTSIATANAGNHLHAEQSAASGSGFADLEGTEVVAGDSGDYVLLDIQKPNKRYVRPIITRGASTATTDILAIKYRGRNVPVTYASIFADLVQVTSPAEGTP